MLAGRIGTRPLVLRLMPGRLQTLLPQAQKRTALDASTVNAAELPLQQRPVALLSARQLLLLYCLERSGTLQPIHQIPLESLKTSALSGPACSACQSYDLLQRQSIGSSWRFRTIETQRRGCGKLFYVHLCSALLTLRLLLRLLQSSCPLQSRCESGCERRSWQSWLSWPLFRQRTSRCGDGGSSGGAGSQSLLFCAPARRTASRRHDKLPSLAMQSR